MRTAEDVFRVFCNVWAYVSCRGYAGIPQGRTAQAVKQGGNADNGLFVLDRKRVLSGRFYFPDTEETTMIYALRWRP